RAAQGFGELFVEGDALHPTEGSSSGLAREAHERALRLRAPVAPAVTPARREALLALFAVSSAPELGAAQQKAAAFPDLAALAKAVGPADLSAHAARYRRYIALRESALAGHADAAQLDAFAREAG